MTQNVHLPPLCVHCLFFLFLFLLLSALCLKCAHASLFASGCSVFLHMNMQGEVLKYTHTHTHKKHTHAGSLGTTGNYFQRMEQVRGGANCFMGLLCETERCQLKSLPFLCTPNPLFSVENCMGKCHCIYMSLLQRGCIYLSLSERLICPSPENTGCAQTASKCEHEFSNNSEPLLRATQRCAESLSPPVITLKTEGMVEKTHLPVKTLFPSLIVPCTFIELLV